MVSGEKFSEYELEQIFTGCLMVLACAKGVASSISKESLANMSYVEASHLIAYGVSDKEEDQRLRVLPAEEQFNGVLAEYLGDDSLEDPPYFKNRSKFAGEIAYLAKSYADKIPKDSKKFWNLIVSHHWLQIGDTESVGFNIASVFANSNILGAVIDAIGEADGIGSGSNINRAIYGYKYLLRHIIDNEQSWEGKEIPEWVINVCKESADITRCRDQEFLAVRAVSALTAFKTRQAVDLIEESYPDSVLFDYINNKGSYGGYVCRSMSRVKEAAYQKIGMSPSLWLVEPIVAEDKRLLVREEKNGMRDEYSCSLDISNNGQMFKDMFGVLKNRFLAKWVINECLAVELKNQQIFLPEDVFGKRKVSMSVVGGASSRRLIFRVRRLLLNQPEIADNEMEIAERHFKELPRAVEYVGLEKVRSLYIKPDPASKSKFFSEVMDIWKNLIKRNELIQVCSVSMDGDVNQESEKNKMKRNKV